MNGKILIGSIFATLLMFLVPFTAIAAEPSNDAPKEAEEKTAPTLTDQLPAFDDPSTLTNEDLVRSIEDTIDLLRDLGDESTADAIEQELSLVLESDEVIINSVGSTDCLTLRLSIIAYTAAASYAFALWLITRNPEYLAWAITFAGTAINLKKKYNEECGGNLEDVTLATVDLTAISGETFTTNGCNLCGSS
jgi:hypothetical protein